MPATAKAPFVRLKWALSRLTAGVGLWQQQLDMLPQRHSHLISVMSCEGRNKISMSCIADQQHKCCHTATDTGYGFVTETSGWQHTTTAPQGSSEAVPTSGEMPLCNPPLLLQALSHGREKQEEEFKPSTAQRYDNQPSQHRKYYHSTELHICMKNMLC